MRLLVIGAGGHAKVVIDTARAAGHEIAGVVGRPQDPAELLGIAVVSDASDLEADGFVVAIGDNAARARVFEEYLERGLRPAAVVHPSAIIAEGVRIGDGTLVVAGAIVNPDANIGRNAIVNTGCTIDHDCVIGDHALIGPGANLCGGCRVGEGTLVGVGAAMAPMTSVGEWSVVGAGAAVVDAMPARSVCVGVPARVVRAIPL